MKKTELIMGMPVTVEVVDPNATEDMLNEIFDYFRGVDEKFSTYKSTSEISAINRGEITGADYSEQMAEVFRLSEETKLQTNGYFDILHQGKYDPSGIVKGWAIYNAARLLHKLGAKNYYLDAGGDIQVSGRNLENRNWRIGIKNPFNESEIVKVLEVSNQGVATSGTYIRGDHIYNPMGDADLDEIVSLTVIGPNVYEADRFATAAFAMGANGIKFIEKLSGFEAYQIDKDGIATFTSGFARYVK